MLPWEPKPDRQQGCNSFYHSWLSCRFLNQTFGCYEVTGSRAHEGNVCSVQSLASRLRFSNRLSLSPIYTSVTIFPNIVSACQEVWSGGGQKPCWVVHLGKDLGNRLQLQCASQQGPFQHGTYPVLHHCHVPALWPSVDHLPAGERCEV